MPSASSRRCRACERHPDPACRRLDRRGAGAHRRRSRAQAVDYSDIGSTVGAVNFPQVQLHAAPAGTRFIHVQRNVPGMLRRLNDVFANREVNISAQNYQTDGEVGYVVMEADSIGRRGARHPARDRGRSTARSGPGCSISATDLFVLTPLTRRASRRACFCLELARSRVRSRLDPAAIQRRPDAADDACRLTGSGAADSRQRPAHGHADLCRTREAAGSSPQFRCGGWHDRRRRDPAVLIQNQNSVVSRRPPPRASRPVQARRLRGVTQRQFRAPQPHRHRLAAGRPNRRRRRRRRRPRKTLTHRSACGSAMSPEARDHQFDRLRHQPAARQRARPQGLGFSRHEGEVSPSSRTGTCTSLKGSCAAAMSSIFRDKEASRPDAEGNLDLRLDATRDTRILLEARLKLDTQRPGSPDLNAAGHRPPMGLAIWRLGRRDP
jgi:hypothetical protein